MARSNRSRNRSGEELPKAKLNRENLSQAFRLFAYLKPYRRPLSIAMVLLFLGSALSLCFVYFLGNLVGGSFSQNWNSEVALQLDGLDQTAMILGAILLTQAIVAFFRVWLLSQAGERALVDVRRDTYAQVIELPMAFFAQRRVGELSSRLAADLSQLQEVFVYTVPQFLRQSAVLLGSLILLFSTSFKLTLFMLAVIPVLVVATGFFGRKIRGLSRSAQDKLAESQTVVEETLQGIANVKAFGNESFERDRYNERLGESLQLSLSGAKFRGLFISFIIFALFGGIVLVLWFAGQLVESGGIEAVELTRFIFYSIFVAGSIASLPEVYSQVQKALGSTQRVREILNEKPEMLTEGRGDEGGVLEVREAIAFDDIHFFYPSRPEISVIHGASFALGAGQKVALVGPSGSGKSTLAALLMRFYDAVGGKILIDGRDHREFSLQRLRAAMSIVPQEVLLFGGSIGENIAYGRPGCSQEEIEAAAAKANATEFIEKMPERYDTIVGERGVQLSGGQRQRIAIARALLKDPAILILDEATSSLDSESERLVQEALEVLMEGRTTLIIAHRLATVRDCDRIIVLNEGRVVEQGTHDELTQDENGLYATLSRWQFAM